MKRTTPKRIVKMKDKMVTGEKKNKVRKRSILKVYHYHQFGSVVKDNFRFSIAGLLFNRDVGKSNIYFIYHTLQLLYTDIVNISKERNKHI